MSTAPRIHAALLAVGAVLLSTAAGAPAAVAAAATTCGTALASAVVASTATDGYSYVATNDYHDSNGTDVRTTLTYKRDNVHQRLAMTDPEHPGVASGIYADATGYWQAIDRRRLPAATVAALALLHKSDVHWFLRTTLRFSDIRVGEITDVTATRAGLPLTSTTTDVDGTTTIVCSATALGQTDTMTASVAGTGRIATLAWTSDASDSHARSTLQLDYTTPTVTAPPSADTVDVALVHKARNAVLLPGWIKQLARAITSYSYAVARARHHARPTYADIRHAARAKTAAFNRDARAAGKPTATVVNKAHGATVYAVAPITGKRTAYYVHRVGRQVLMARR